ncbi:hypothetical protein F5Y19DRAFT_477498 [Xylariaceae sp. FL1651]|nr:hypothetical protein F5Y19DRAFT_477498 [Xylariaceae sp. FL1651]
MHSCVTKPLFGPNITFYKVYGWSCRLGRLSLLLIIIVSFSAGVIATNLIHFFESSHSGPKSPFANAPPSTEGTPDFPYLIRTFSYNRTFGADPAQNKFTEDAWDSLVPLGQGTVKLSNGTSQVYTLSIMHQLHCLWSIHESFYTALHAHPEDVDMQDFPHIRHCFDYVRQSIMCSADVTLEPVDLALGGVTGWDGKHICRDFGSVTAWAEDHRTNNLRGFREAHKAHSAHNPH